MYVWGTIAGTFLVPGFLGYHSMFTEGREIKNLSSVLRDTTPGNRKPRCVYVPSIPLMRTTCRGRESSGPPSLSSLHHSNSPQTFFALSPCTINTQETHPCVGDSKVRGRSARAVLRQVCLLGDITAAGWARPHQAGRRRAAFVSHAELIKNRSTACLDTMQWFELTLMIFCVCSCWDLSWNNICI